MADFARSDDPAVQAQLDRLALLSPGGDRLGLDRITRLLDRLGNPQGRLPPVFHVAGTNGKGSTCAFLRAAMETAGYSVHVFTSPHLVRFNERIRVAGKLIADSDLAALLAETLDAGDGIDASFFEVTTAVAFLAFARAPADACIIEVGLGGRLDSTNVFDHPLVTGIASIGLDHQQFLGTDIRSIAREKAGIAKRRVPLVVLGQVPEAEEEIASAAEALDARLWLEGRDWHLDKTLLPALPGAHQVANANLAWQMLQLQEAFAVSRAQFEAGLAIARWPARFQKLGDGPLTRSVETWLDGAHNPAAAEALAGLLAEHGPMHIVFGILANKDAAAIIGALASQALSMTFVPVPDHAHHDPADLASRYDGRAAGSLEEALDGLAGPRLIAGSLYLAGEALRLNGEQPD